MDAQPFTVALTLSSPKGEYIRLERTVWLDEGEDVNNATSVDMVNEVYRAAMATLGRAEH